MTRDASLDRNSVQRQALIEGDASESEVKKEKDKGVYLGVDDDDMAIDDWGPQSDVNFDGLADIWKEMTVALECSKVC